MITDNLGADNAAQVLLYDCDEEIERYTLSRL